VVCIKKTRHNKKGPYGFYSEYNKQKKSLLHWTHYDQIQDYIDRQQFPCEYIEDLIHFNKDYSIRKGKYGDYVYYKTSNMKNRCFIN